MVEIMIIRAEKEIGMGCCGGICGDGFIEMKDEFKHHDPDRQLMGEFYRRLEATYGDQILINFLDPRNIFAIGMYFMKQVKDRHIPLFKAIKHFSLHIKYNAVFINGKYTEDLENCDTLIEDMLYA
ncbi:hypothetical protein [Halobacillus amylolyticus]|uniref:Uncharacterized protein n=1 Tax=Halobacillus amylolyticus TaxID=2932259 RepID=A0ABY4H834_9BACI|nr:hypothetical protein [Halobacillus amylolyticus]UOR11036.1 hypothetical protein MUO15_15735 [Halobacillus amylolyticus]